MNISQLFCLCLAWCGKHPAEVTLATGAVVSCFYKQLSKYPRMRAFFDLLAHMGFNLPGVANALSRLLTGKSKAAQMTLPVALLCLTVGCGAAAQVKAASATAAQRGATYVVMEGFALVSNACEVAMADPSLAPAVKKCEQLLPVAHDLISEAFLVVNLKHPFDVATACDLAAAADTLATLGMLLPLPSKDEAVLKDAVELSTTIVGFCPSTSHAADAGAE